MQSPAPEIVAGYPSGCVVDKDANPETTLGSAYSPVDYMSITSFPRLPEDDMLSGENTLKSRKDDDNVLSEQDTGESGRSDTVTTKAAFQKYIGFTLRISCMQNSEMGFCPPVGMATLN